MIPLSGVWHHKDLGGMSQRFGKRPYSLNVLLKSHTCKQAAHILGKKELENLISGLVQQL